ncbi:type II toxin-antitoxin system VapC family toxin [Agromyces laixinhei]|uniref:type II toxin-antitoxin system VapC family toxin n=1 Tax=Agromyces laixinhei TaxID=2585717 RepID=UPI0012ED19FF|nr:type II toxin-antitoxin system VapC family toxin [Agromyces laixinhei]
MIVLDASVVIAHLSSHDAHHERAVAFFRANVAEAFVMHSLTMTEILVGPIRVGRSEAAEHALASLGISEWMPPAGSAARLARVRVESGLKLPDCCVLDAALSNRGRIATFDGRLAQAAHDLGVEVIQPG